MILHPIEIAFLILPWNCKLNKGVIPRDNGYLVGG